MSLTIQHIRNATSIITINGKTILVDPMLSDVGQLPPVPLTRSLRRNPISPLPVSLDTFDYIDAILVTHLHFDHFDKAAQQILNKGIPVFCQPADQQKLKDWGFHNVYSIKQSRTWCGIDIRRISGQHAKGFTARLLGPVSGYILNTPGEGSLYIVGDCILTDPIRQVFAQYQPHLCIVNAPRAQMLFGTIITMTPSDIKEIIAISPSSQIIAVHMEAISHCTLTRAALSKFLGDHRISEHVYVPNDGEFITIQPSCANNQPEMINECISLETSHK
ncbi:MBL fold metallo-hydrolase [Paenibacillus sp. strain BS8-2]